MRMCGYSMKSHVAKPDKPFLVFLIVLISGMVIPPHAEAESTETSTPAFNALRSRFDGVVEIVHSMTRYQSDGGQTGNISLFTPDVDTSTENKTQEGDRDCSGNLHFTGNIQYALPGYSDGAVTIDVVRNTGCSSLQESDYYDDVGKDNGGVRADQPLRRARVELWINNQFFMATCSDQEGDFEFCLNNNNPSVPGSFRIEVISCPDCSTEGDACGSLAGVPTDYSVSMGSDVENVYYLATSTESGVCYGTIDWSIYDRRHDVSDAMYIYDLLANDAYDRIQIEAGWANDKKLSAVFPAENTSFSSSPPVLRVTEGDQQDPDVILHTYSYFVMHEIYNHELPTVTVNCDSHAWGIPSDPGCAMIHGTTLFLQAAMQNDSVLEDTPAPGSPPTVQLDLEPPHPPVASGIDEGAVAACLWDLFDPANEAFDTVSAGLLPIWNILSNENPFDICAFL